MASASIKHDAYYPHSPERVWSALTDSARIADWLMPNTFVGELGHAVGQCVVFAQPHMVTASRQHRSQVVEQRSHFGAFVVRYDKHVGHDVQAIQRLSALVRATNAHDCPPGPALPSRPRQRPSPLPNRVQIGRAHV